MFKLDLVSMQSQRFEKNVLNSCFENNKTQTSSDWTPMCLVGLRVPRFPVPLRWLYHRIMVLSYVRRKWLCTMATDLNSANHKTYLVFCWTVEMIKVNLVTAWLWMMNQAPRRSVCVYAFKVTIKANNQTPDVQKKIN